MTKRNIIKAVNSLLTPLGIAITRPTRTGGLFVEQIHDPSSSYMKDDKLKRMLINELSQVGRTFFSERLSDIANDDFDFKFQVENFLSLYSNRPLRDNIGGSGFHNAFWLFLFARALNPVFIIESGVWRGHMSWLFEQACPDAAILGFDINLGNLEYKKGKVIFHQQDWSEYQLGNIDSEKSLVFFDCHVNHAKRILEAYDRGFRHLLFDDNPPIYKLYGYGLPGFPTANMINTGLGIELPEVSWCWQGKYIKYKINKDYVKKASELIKVHEVFPDVGGPTRYGGFSFLTYVRI